MQDGVGEGKVRTFRERHYLEVSLLGLQIGISIELFEKNTTYSGRVGSNLDSGCRPNFHSDKAGMGTTTD
jgi:hypothetical protein